AAGEFHALALKSDGTVWAWGLNNSGQLGTRTGHCSGNTSCSTVPVKVDTLTGITAIAGGWNHTLALKSDGTVWAWGDNSAGQLGDNTTTTRSAPIQVKGPGGSGFLTSGRLLSAGSHHSLAVKSDGTVWGW